MEIATCHLCTSKRFTFGYALVLYYRISESTVIAGHGKEQHAVWRNLEDLIG
jgi:hypothetical protein